jgi:hypothetical protein
MADLTGKPVEFRVFQCEACRHRSYFNGKGPPLTITKKLRQQSGEKSL